MDQEKIGNFIKSIRKKHNLTQKQFADKPIKLLANGKMVKTCLIILL